MEENIEPSENFELPEVEETAWRDNAVDIAKDFFIVYGTISFILDITRFMCNE